MDEQGLQKQAGITLNRLTPRIKQVFEECEPQEWERFETRLARVFPRLFRLYHRLYSSRYDFYYHLETLLEGMARSWLARPADLKALDREREAEPLWFQSNKMLGGVIYVDLFAGDLQGVRAKIPYFKELGLTYLHLMPLFLAPEGDNDGGYAVSSYREVEPRLGSMKELAALAKELREQGISLVLDLVFNHTSDEHIWAQKAKTGDETYQEYFRMFDDRTMPDAYESRLREIFPDEHPGAFTYWPEIKKWVWTTFHAYQWDLNYANPMVFNDMAQEMLFLANMGVEVLRLDAVAFIWKELGTDCENLPAAHLMIQAFNAVARIAAPALLFKSEAIVHPDEVVRYIGPDECQLSYNPLVMALLWNSLATRETRLLDLALKERFAIDPRCAWVNYVRVHDDIGWTFSDEDAARLNINGYDHRRFLNAFYTGRFPGSFARGLPFQENPLTGDARISGTCASLAGLEKGIRADEMEEIEFSIRRILLLHGVILTLGGIPLIYLGDEIGAINDYSYQNDPAKARDSRWVHRPFTNWNRMGQRHDPETIPGRIYTGLQTLIRMRKEHTVFTGNEMTVIKQDNPHVLAYIRFNGSARALVFANFSERAQTIPGNLLRLYGLSYRFDDIVSGESPAASAANGDLTLAPYQFRCLKA